MNRLIVINLIKSGIIKIIKSRDDDYLENINIGNYSLFIPKNHALRNILKRWPQYSLNIARIAEKIKSKYMDLHVIDVGANIGDTVALIKSYVDCPILCIEGEKKYFKILIKNINQFKNVDAFNIYLGETDLMISVDQKVSSGTNRLDFISPKMHIQITSLDTFISDKREYSKYKLLKIDTDGYDFKIIRGGMKFIAKQKPVLFIEYEQEYLKSNNEDGIYNLLQLRNVGYHSIIYYDNHGRFLLSTDLKNDVMIRQLYEYTNNLKGAFQYYDICIFHNEDESLAQKIIASEERYRRKL
jgi:FkbM family methyltransferase